LNRLTIVLSALDQALAASEESSDVMTVINNEVEN
jgi:hypothetical protein